MVKTGAGEPKGIIVLVFWVRLSRRLSMPERHESFQDRCNVLIGESVISVSAFADHGQEAACEQLCQMRTRASGRHSRSYCEFVRRQCSAIHQRGQHGGTTGISDQGRCRRDLRLATHIKELSEASLVVQGAESAPDHEGRPR